MWTDDDEHFAESDEEGDDYDDYGYSEEDDDEDGAHLAEVWAHGVEDLGADEWNRYMGAEHLACIDLDKDSVDADHQRAAMDEQCANASAVIECDVDEDEWGEDGLVQGRTTACLFAVPEANERQRQICTWLMDSSLIEMVPGTPDEFEVTTRNLVKLADGKIVSPVGWLVDEGFRPGLLVHGHQVSYRNRQGTATVQAVVFTKRPIFAAPFRLANSTCVKGLELANQMSIDADDVPF